MNPHITHQREQNDPLKTLNENKDPYSSSLPCPLEETSTVTSTSSASFSSSEATVIAATTASEECLSKSSGFPVKDSSHLNLSNNPALVYLKCCTDVASQVNPSCSGDRSSHSSYAFTPENQPSWNCGLNESVMSSSLMESCETHVQRDTYKNFPASKKTFLSDYQHIPPSSASNNTSNCLADPLNLPVADLNESCGSNFNDTLNVAGYSCGGSNTSTDYVHSECHAGQKYSSQPAATTETSQCSLINSSRLTQHDPYDSLDTHSMSILPQPSLYANDNLSSGCQANLSHNMMGFPQKTYLVPQNTPLSTSVYSYPDYTASFHLASNATDPDSCLEKSNTTTSTTNGTNATNRDPLLCETFISDFCHGPSNMSFVLSPEQFSEPKQLLSMNRTHETQNQLSPGRSDFFMNNQPFNIRESAPLQQTAAHPVEAVRKRPRGRPRKKPPLLVLDQNLKSNQENGQNTTTASTHSGLTSNVTQKSYTLSKDSEEETQSRSVMCEKSPAQSTNLANLLHKRAMRCLDALWALQTTYYIQKQNEIESMNCHEEVSEEYLALGGPYTPLALALQVQQQQTTHQKASDSGSAAKTSAEIVQHCSREMQQLIINLNSSFVWSSLEIKCPVRDIAASRYHLVALLNDSRVFVYRHKTHPLVISRVNQWEHVEALDHCGIVAVRITSANLPTDWREKYHSIKRIEFIKRIRQKLRASSILLPSTTPFSSDDLTLEELRLFVEHHSMGILCCPTSSLNADWLPEPFVIAALDQNGVVRLAKCCGFYNYPIVMKTSTPSSSSTSTSAFSVSCPKTNAMNGEPVHASNLFTQQGMNHHEASFSASDPFSLISGSKNDYCKDATTNQYLSITKNIVHVDRVDKQLQLSVPSNETTKDGEVVKIFARVQEIGLAELTEQSLLSPSGGNPEVAMILYALADKEHSAFVKGKNLYIRFKNFPTGPIKMYCGPLGHCGAVLLANGTVWTWSAQANAPGSSNGKLGVHIHQVKGSLEGKTVIDMTAIGADFLALTSDGVVHEWNCYGPYISIGQESFDTTVPQGFCRPNIPEPIELTPSFQKKILSRRSHKDVCYKVGCFAWTLPEQHNSNPKDNDKNASTCDPSTFSYLSSAFNKEDNRAIEKVKDGTGHITSTDSLQESCQESKKKSDEEGLPCDREVSNPFELNTKKNPVYDSLVSPFLHLESSNYLLHCESSCRSTPLELHKGQLGEKESQKHPVLPQEEEQDGDGWKASDYSSEETLEKHRQEEIRRRYSGVVDMNSNGMDLIERIFLFEGITLFLRSRSAQFSYIVNNFASYRTRLNSRWCDLYSSLGEKVFLEKHAECFIRAFGQLGKPLITNPVVLARLKVSQTAEKLNEEVREQLQAMADLRPPVYRLLYSPVSLLVCILCRYDSAAEARQRLNYSLPVPIAAFNPSLYFEAFSGIPLHNVYLPSSRVTYSVIAQNIRNNPIINKYNRCGDLDDDYDQLDNSKSSRKEIQWRGRGRVGRPRGSRSAFRTSMTQQRHLKNLSTKKEKTVRQIPLETKSDDREESQKYIPTQSKLQRNVQENNAVSSTTDEVLLGESQGVSAPSNVPDMISSTKNQPVSLLQQHFGPSQLNSPNSCLNKRSRWETNDEALGEAPNSYYMLRKTNHGVYTPWNAIVNSLNTEDNTQSHPTVVHNDTVVKAEHDHDQHGSLLNEQDDATKQVTIH